jgi:hypothetical protein
MQTNSTYLLLQLCPQPRKQSHLNMLQYLDYIFVGQIKKIGQSDGEVTPKIG